MDYEIVLFLFFKDKKMPNVLKRKNMQKILKTWAFFLIFSKNIGIFLRIFSLEAKFFFSSIKKHKNHSVSFDIHIEIFFLNQFF